MRAVPLLLCLALAGPATAQIITPGQLEEALGETRQRSVEVASGTIVTLRALDKVSGALADLEVPVGSSAAYQRITVEVLACRYPSENPASDAFAYLRLTDSAHQEPLFQGWMIASSPALNALDHPRYDIWVLACR